MQSTQPEQPMLPPPQDPITESENTENKSEPQQIEDPDTQIQQKICSTCGQALTYYSQNEKYYCH